MPLNPCLRSYLEWFINIILADKKCMSTVKQYSFIFFLKWMHQVIFGIGLLDFVYMYLRPYYCTKCAQATKLNKSKVKN